MATLTTITTGMVKWSAAINANDTALNNDIATLTAGQNLTWIDLPLEGGITGNLSVAASYNGSIIYIKGQINGNFTNDTLLSKCIGTPLINLTWADVPVVTSQGVQSFQIKENGELHYEGTTISQINANGLFIK